LAEAKADFQRWQKPTGIGITQPVGKPIPRGKRIDMVVPGTSSAHLTVAPFVAAAHKVGWSVKVISAALDPAGQQAAMSQAVADHPAGVVYPGFASAVIGRQLAALAKAKIPVVSQDVTNSTDAAKRYVETPAPSQVPLIGERLAAAITVATDGKGKVMLVTVPAFTIYAPIVASVVRNLKTFCPLCKVGIYDLPVADVATGYQQAIVSYIQGHPGTNAVLDTFGSLTIGLAPALQGAGIDPSSIKLVGLWVPPEVVNMTREGQEFAVVPEPFSELSWEMVDALARMFVGDSVAPDAHSPGAQVIWTHSNAPSNTGGAEFPAVVKNYQRDFEKLWGKS